MLRRTALLLAVVAALAACKPSPTAPPVASTPTTGSQPAGAPTLDVVELSAVDAAAKMKSGELTSHELTQAYLDRIAKMDKAGPAVNAIIELNPDALKEA